MIYPTHARSFFTPPKERFLAVRHTCATDTCVKRFRKKTIYESASASASNDNHSVEVYYTLMLYSGEDQLKMHDLMERYYPRAEE